MKNIRFFTTKNEFNQALNELSKTGTSHVAYTQESDEIYITPTDRNILSQRMSIEASYKSSKVKNSKGEYAHNIAHSDGESLTPSVKYTLTTVYVDGTVETKTNGGVVTFSGNLVNSTNGTITVPAKDKNNIEKQIVTRVVVTVTVDGYTDSTTFPIYQAKLENYVVKTEWSAPTGLSLSSTGDIPASGGSVYAAVVNGTIQQTYTETWLLGEQDVTTYTYNINDPEVSTQYLNTVSAPSLDTTVTNGRTKVGTLQYRYTVNGKSTTTSVDVYQEQNKLEDTWEKGGETSYGTLTNLITDKPKVIPASGGTATVNAYTAKQSWTTTAKYAYSGFTARPDNPYSILISAASSGTNDVLPQPSAISATASNLYKTIKDEAVIKEEQVKWVGQGEGNTSTSTLTIKQAANKVESSITTVTAGKITPKTIHASGGSATATAANGTYQTIDKYSSNAEDIISGSVTPSQTKLTATASSKGVVASEVTEVDSVDVVWEKNGVRKADRLIVWQAENKVVSTREGGGITTYKNVTAGTITEATIPSSGGTGITTISDGKQSYVKTETYSYDTYSSGEEAEGVLIKNGESGEKLIPPSQSSLVGTMNSLGATLSESGVVTSAVITWSGYNSLSTSGRAHVYHEANKRVREVYDGDVNLTLYTRASANTMSDVNIPYNGGSAIIISEGSINGRYLYSSGSYGPYNLTPSAITPTLSISDTVNFELVGNTVRAKTTNDSTEMRVCVVTSTYGSKSATCLVYQNRKPYTSPIKLQVITNSQLPTNDVKAFRIEGNISMSLSPSGKVSATYKNEQPFEFGDSGKTMTIGEIVWPNVKQNITDVGGHLGCALLAASGGSSSWAFDYKAHLYIDDVKITESLDIFQTQRGISISDNMSYESEEAFSSIDSTYQIGDNSTVRIVIAEYGQSLESGSSVGSIVSYSEVTAGTTTIGVIPASGGSAVTTIGYGKQHGYDIEGNIVRTIAIEPSIQTLEGSAPSRGLETGPSRTVVSEVVTWIGRENKSVTGLATVEQQENKVEYSMGGDVSYGEINPGNIDTPNVIPASGGSVDITFSKGTQTVTKTAIYDYYTSSSSKVRQEASTSTINVDGSASKTTVTANSKGTSVSDVTDVEEVTVVWRKNNKTASKSVTVKQAANKVVSTEYGEISLSSSLSNPKVTCAAGSTMLTVKTYHKSRNKYTSGEYDPYGEKILYNPTKTPTMTNNTSWVSISSLSRSATGTYTGLTSYECNCQQIIDRECRLTATLSGETGNVILTQAKDSYTESIEHSDWSGGKITLNNTNSLSAGEDSRTITIDPWYRETHTVRTWTCGDVTYTTPVKTYYSGTVNISDNHNKVTLSTSSYSNAGANPKTITLTKATDGTTATTSSVCTVTAVGPTTTTYSINVTANKQTAVYDGTATVDVSVNPTSIANTGGSATISCNGSVKGRYSYTSGEYGLYELTSAVTPNLSINDSTNFTLNGTTITTKGANTTSTSRTCTITATYGAASDTCTLKHIGTPAVTFKVTDANNSETNSISYIHPGITYVVKSYSVLNNQTTPINWSISSATTTIPNGHIIYKNTNGTSWTNVTNSLASNSVEGGNSVSANVYIGPNDPGFTVKYWIKPDLNNLVRASLINGDYNLQLTFKQNGQSATTSRKVVYKQTLTSHLVYQVSANTVDSVSFDATGGTLTVLAKGYFQYDFTTGSQINQLALYTRQCGVDFTKTVNTTNLIDTFGTPTITDKGNGITEYKATIAPNEMTAQTKYTLTISSKEGSKSKDITITQTKATYSMTLTPSVTKIGKDGGDSVITAVVKCNGSTVSKPTIKWILNYSYATGDTYDNYVYFVSGSNTTLTSITTSNGETPTVRFRNNVCHDKKVVTVSANVLKNNVAQISKTTDEILQARKPYESKVMFKMNRKATTLYYSDGLIFKGVLNLAVHSTGNEAGDGNVSCLLQTTTPYPIRGYGYGDTVEIGKVAWPFEEQNVSNIHLNADCACVSSGGTSIDTLNYNLRLLVDDHEIAKSEPYSYMTISGVTMDSLQYDTTENKLKGGQTSFDVHPDSVLLIEWNEYGVSDNTGTTSGDTSIEGSTSAYSLTSLFDEEIE